MERIIFVRHGQTNKNAKGEIHAFGDEELLNEVGIEQIKKTVDKLKGFLPIRVVYSSRGKRALQSGEIIAKGLEVKLESIDGMEERNWGDFVGRNWAEVEKILNPMTLEERYLYVPPNGESWEHFETRLIQAINNVLFQNKGETIVIVSHGGAIRALMPYFLGVSRDKSFEYSPDIASITIFDHENGKFSPVLINDTEHLK